jgi:hypothetical protein
MRTRIVTAFCALGLILAALHASLAGRRGRDYPGPPGWVLPGAALDFNFGQGLYYQTGNGACRTALNCLSTSRASAGTASDLGNVWYQFAAGVPRITNLGLLVEESRTNSIRNNTMAGAGIGSLPTNWTGSAQSGLTQTIVGTGTESGIAYVDWQVSGTTTGTGNSFLRFDNSIAASPGQVWTGSVFVELVGGSLTNISQVAVNLEDHASGGGFLSNTQTIFTPSAAALGSQRYSVTNTAVASTTLEYLTLTVRANSGVAVNVTLRVGWPQEELGVGATSPILTATAAATRAADFITVTRPPKFGTSLTAFVTATPNMPTTYATTQTPLQIDEGDSNSRIDIDRPTGGFLGDGITVASTPYTGAGTGTIWPTGAQWNIASAFAANDHAIVGAGKLGTATGNPMFAPSRAVIGANGNGVHQFNGTIARLALWPTTRQPNGFLTQVAQ